MLESVPGLALLAFDDSGEAQYAGETAVAWDDQVPCRDVEDRVTLECPDGHRWQTRHTLE
jgi:hypothetical protein